MQLPTWGKRWVALADVYGVWNAVSTACGCVDATNLIVVVVATSFVSQVSVMKRSKIFGVSGKFSSGELVCWFVGDRGNSDSADL